MDALGQALIFPGQGIRRRVFDGRTMLSADRVPRTGNLATPYILGSTKYGSSMSGPHAHDDPPKGAGLLMSPPREAVPDAMEALFAALTGQDHPGVRAVLGHFAFGLIHPYPAGNGRIGRFLMNAMLASGGYPWTVIRVTRRADYLAALEAASTRGHCCVLPLRCAGDASGLV